MFPSFLRCCSLLETPRKKKKNTGRVITDRDQNLEKAKVEADPAQLVSFHVKPMGSGKQTDQLSLRSEMAKPRSRSRRTKGETAAGRSWTITISDLIQQVAAACNLPKPVSSGEQESCNTRNNEEDENEAMEGTEFAIIKQVFDAVSVMTLAYISLQEAHNPWDPHKLMLADVAVVGELRRLGDLRARYLRRTSCYGGTGGIREAVAPYEAALAELKREVKARDMEIENLKENLKSMVMEANCGKKSRTASVSGTKVHCITQVTAAPAPELFEEAMSGVREALDTFTSVLLSLMRAAHWDISAAVRAIEAATAPAKGINAASSVIQTQRANPKFALQSYISRILFQGFEHESFYMDNGLSSVLIRLDCFTQYCDMKGMDITELIVNSNYKPSCNDFSKFCFNKYLDVIHHKMEESFFGDLEQRRQVVEGSHPRSRFYMHFLDLAKAMWLLHLLAFSLDPPPSRFDASRGGDYHPDYMDSVLRYPGKDPSGQVVGFPLTPGFKLGNGAIIKARVYLVSP